MKNRGIKKFTGILMVIILSTMVLSGCGKSGREESGSAAGARQIQENQNSASATDDQIEENGTTESDRSSSELAVTFGDSGDTFTMHLYDDNDTAAAIAGHVGTSGWRLPIYERDDVNYEVMQYYDIPSRYEIPSNAQQITAVTAGEVYYSDPNRVLLFYEGTEISGEYTLIGYFDPTEEFVTAVRENPVLEGWGNKIIQIEQP